MTGGNVVNYLTADDAEFAATNSPTELDVVSGEAATRVDLLTVVMHELGHELLKGDVDGSLLVGDLMSETLTPGVRRLPKDAASTPAYAAARALELNVRPSSVESMKPSARSAIIEQPAETGTIAYAEVPTLRLPKVDSDDDDLLLSGIAVD